MGYKNYILYCGNEAKSFESYFNGEKVSIKSDFEEDYDKKAIKIISSISSITVSPDNDTNLKLDFTPITDEDFLQAVSSNKTKVRVQLLYNEPGVGSDLIIYDPDWHWFKTGHLNRSRRNRRCINVGFTNFKNGQICYMRKPHSHDYRYYGRTYKDLTANELRNGSVILDSIDTVCRSRSYSSPSIPIEIDNGYDSWIEGKSGDRIISAELYIPCLFKSNTDTFSYERHGGRKIASNCIFLNESLSSEFGVNKLSLESNILKTFYPQE